jgi:uncharacterized protein
VTVDLSFWNYVLIALAALAAGLVNAFAGGGTLISFPTLTWVGLDAITANITNTVALCPGYFGATMAQAKDLRDQMPRVRLLLPTAIIGGLLGATLLLNTEERVFKEVVPYLILLATGLLAFQPPLRAWIVKRTQQSGGEHRFFAVIMIFLAAIYGGYFGAGLGMIVLASLGLALDDNLTRLNALKQAISFSVNTAAALLFLFSGNIIWSVVIVMAVAALIGGSLGGRLAGYISPNVLRWTVVTIGLIVAIIYLVR